MCVGMPKGSQTLLPFPGLAKPPSPQFSPSGVGSQETQRGADPGASLVQGEPGEGRSARRQRGSPEPAAGSVGHCCPLALQTLAKGKVISTDHLKLFLSRRKWQVNAGAGAGGEQSGVMYAGQDGVTWPGQREVTCTRWDDATPPIWA